MPNQKMFTTKTTLILQTPTSTQIPQAKPYPVLVESNAMICLAQ